LSDHGIPAATAAAGAPVTTAKASAPQSREQLEAEMKALPTAQARHALLKAWRSQNNQ